MKEFGKGESSPKKKEEEIEIKAPPSLEEISKAELEDYSSEVSGPEAIFETVEQNTEYLKEGSEAQEEALKEAVEVDKKLIVDHDYGSSEWCLITSAINEKIDFRAYTHAMPLGKNGSKGCIVKTLTLHSGGSSVHTFYSPTLRVYPDQNAVNLYILK